MQSEPASSRVNERVQSWLLAVLRFAVTLKQSDRAAVLIIAQALDRPEARQEPDTFKFFQRTSTQLCNSIADRRDPDGYQTFQHHMARVDDRRLRLALEVAVRCDRPLARAVPKPKTPRIQSAAGLLRDTQGVIAGTAGLGVTEPVHRL